MFIELFELFGSDDANVNSIKPSIVSKFIYNQNIEIIDINFY